MGYAKQGKELKKSAFQNRVGKITMQSFKNPKFMIFLSSNKLSQFLQKLAEYNQKIMLMPFFNSNNDFSNSGKTWIFQDKSVLCDQTV